MQRFDDRHELLEMSGEYWDANQAINLRPVAFTAKAVAPGMIAAGGGTIVNFTSTSYMLNIGAMPAYTAAKAGIVGLTKGLAGRLGTRWHQGQCHRAGLGDDRTAKGALGYGGRSRRYARPAMSQTPDRTG
jgi:NAD(P)-dependent dehydrogenase (short-subunit alcohol dehydrogenase family)